jgi:LmbE family N-acetylglucosaminyl deacetylase
MFGQRILIPVPHPDDEVVACAAAIGRAQAQGASIFTLYLTNGCIARETLWPWQRKHYDRMVARRHAEGEAASLFLNITPIGWNPRPARYLWRHLSEVYADVRAAITAHTIDQLWVPAYEGGNADHDGLNAVGRALQLNVNVLEFAEYNFSGGKARSQTFPAIKGNEQTLTLTPTERTAKSEALKIYRSEKGNLDYVKTERECFRPLATYDYSQPPHTGTLWYTRFQWVPFRHPRVDFTRSSEVSESITRFLESI